MGCTAPSCQPGALDAWEAQQREDVARFLTALRQHRDASTGPAPTAVTEHSCRWCQINYYHPKCPQNADEPRCPHCGSDPEDTTMHAEGCRTLGTCASTCTDLPEPWHPEPETWTLQWLQAHLAEAHPDYRRTSW